ncbi:PRC-barrel domain-containing protein [Jannaschia aquimarina]|uniref:PRC-barrel domain protein n=1 Tax=Jannaschia aquimarina TaxID=935700 RepID=A0A0D1EEY7_9RHOB|nr:PRC-barrel domain-containing protein [Jannaschia aquimarina]KIT15456.1 PRC-barrel domain protein [Jannaschia aquimarina]SNT22133.1 PRC-barrel domain-containing protein [Jannaschia aquimarina]
MTIRSILFAGAAALVGTGVIAQEAVENPGSDAEAEILAPEGGETAEAPAAPDAGTETEMAGDSEGLYGAFGDRAVADLIGLNVLANSTEGEIRNVGEVESLVRTAGGGDEVMAVVGVGGFLGFGERDVAVPLASFEENELGLVLPGMTRDELEAMQPYDGAGVELTMDMTVDGQPIAPDTEMQPPTGEDGAAEEGVITE